MDINAIKAELEDIVRTCQMNATVESRLRALIAQINAAE